MASSQSRPGFPLPSRSLIGMLGVLLIFGTIGTDEVAAGNRAGFTVGIYSDFYPVVPYYGWTASYRPARVFRRAYSYSEVDIEIRPSKSRVFVDGKLIGVADDFDGYPGHLLLRPGRHVLGFTHPGRHSLSFELDLRPGDLVKLDRTLPKLAKGEVDPGLPPFEPEPDRGRSSGSPEGKEEDSQATSPGFLEFKVLPPEARVNLDGSFFGTGEELGQIRGGVPLSPGIHRVRVSLVGYESASEEVQISPSKGQTLEIHLKKK